MSPDIPQVSLRPVMGVQTNNAREKHLIGCKRGRSQSAVVAGDRFLSLRIHEQLLVVPGGLVGYRAPPDCLAALLAGYQFRFPQRHEMWQLFRIASAQPLCFFVGVQGATWLVWLLYSQAANSAFPSITRPGVSVDSQGYRVKTLSLHLSAGLSSHRIEPVHSLQEDMKLAHRRPTHLGRGKKGVTQQMIRRHRTGWNTKPRSEPVTHGTNKRATRWF